MSLIAGYSGPRVQPGTVDPSKILCDNYEFEEPHRDDSDRFLGGSSYFGVDVQHRGHSRVGLWVVVESQIIQDPNMVMIESVGGWS